MAWPKTKRWKYGYVSHLFCDPGNIEKLHEFAQKIGLKKEWFQNKPQFPHYDLSPGMRTRAVKSGAEEVSHKDMVDSMNKWRKFNGRSN